ncbi:MAG: FAD-binding oxidoreductase [Acidobacteriota bacterium]
MTAETGQTSASSLPKTADIVILGAGVIGTSIAFHLARRRAGRVVILDKGWVGQGGSGRSSALVRMHYSFPPEVRLAVRSLEYFQNWQEIVGLPGDYRKTGFVRLVPGNEIDRLEKQVAMQRDHGANTRVISPEELKQIEPDWNVDDVVAAAYEPDSGYGDGAGVANDFLARARDMGVLYVPRTRATRFEVAGGRIQGVSTEAGGIEAALVVAAIGPWSRPLFKEIGVDLPIETEYHEVAILKNPPAMKSRGCACIDSILKLYYRAEGHDMTLVGAFYGRRGVDPDQVSDSVSQESLAEMALGSARRIPLLEQAGVVRGIAGVYDMAPDDRPLLGEVPGVEGLHVAAGFSGMGFKISPAVGLAMSELLLDGKATAIDIRDFRPGRFAEGESIQAPHAYQDD